jgi:hypothetical protein
MAKIRKNRIIHSLGWFFLVLGTITAGWYALFSKWQYAFWFCNHAMIITGIAILKKNNYLLTAMLNWSLLPVSAWIIDFLSRLLFGIHPLGITEYMFFGNWWARLLSLQHLITVPLMLYALWLVGRPDKKAWAGTTIHGIILWMISYFLITPDYNVNCVHQACTTILQTLPAYQLLWPIIAFVMFFGTNWVLVRIFQSPKARHQSL